MGMLGDLLPFVTLLIRTDLILQLVPWFTRVHRCEVRLKFQLVLPQNLSC